MSQWTDANVEKLVELWQQGYSASQIGKILRASRNAVIGKLHRMGHTDKSGPRATMRPKEAPSAVKRPMPIQKPSVAPVTLAEPEPIGPLNDIPSKFFQCRFIKDDIKSGDWRACGQPTTNGQYCEYHRQKMFVKTSRAEGQKPVGFTKPQRKVA